MQVRSIAKQTLAWLVSSRIKQTITTICLFLLLPFLVAAALPVPDIIVKGKPWYDVRAYSDWATAVSSIGSTEATVYVLRSEAVSISSTPPSTMDIQVLGGGGFVVASGKALDLSNCYLTAATRQIFSGTGTIVPPKNSSKLEWFSTLAIASSLLSTNPTILTVESNIVVTSTTSMASTIGWRLQSNGRFTVSTGQTLTLAGSFSAPSGKQVFYGDGAVVPSTLQPLDSDWWPSFAKAVADISTNVRTLIVQSAETISGNLTVPTSGDSLQIVIRDGGSLEPAAGTTLTMNTCPEYGNYAVWGGNGTVLFTAKCELRASTEDELIRLKDNIGTVRVVKPITLTGNLTTTCPLYIEPGCSITTDSNDLVVTGPVLSGEWQTFVVSSAGDLTLPGQKECKLAWLGPAADFNTGTGAGTDDGPVLRNAYATGASIIKCTAGKKYRLSTTVYPTSDSTLDLNSGEIYVDSSIGFYYGNGSEIRNAHMKNGKLVFRADSCTMVKVDSSSMELSWSNLRVDSQNDTGSYDVRAGTLMWDISEAWILRMINCVVTGPAKSITMGTEANDIKMIGCSQRATPGDAQSEVLISMSSGANNAVIGGDVEGGYDLVEVTGGKGLTLDHVYLEAANSDSGVLLSGGTAVFTNCRFLSIHPKITADGFYTFRDNYISGYTYNTGWPFLRLTSDVGFTLNLDGNKISRGPLSPAINNIGGYAIGDTVIALDGLVAAVYTTDTLVDLATGTEYGIASVGAYDSVTGTQTITLDSPGLTAAIANDTTVEILCVAPIFILSDDVPQYLSGGSWYSITASYTLHLNQENIWDRSGSILRNYFVATGANSFGKLPATIQQYGGKRILWAAAAPTNVIYYDGTFIFNSAPSLANPYLGWSNTNTRYTTLSADYSGGESAIACVNIGGIRIGDVIKIVLDDGTAQYTKVDGLPGGTTLTLHDVVAGAASTGNGVSTNQWTPVYLTVGTPASGNTIKWNASNYPYWVAP